MAALDLLTGVHPSEWRALMKGEDKLPYFVASVAQDMDSAVRAVCPAGYEVDR